MLINAVYWNNIYKSQGLYSSTDSSVFDLFVHFSLSVFSVIASHLCRTVCQNVFFFQRSPPAGCRSFWWRDKTIPKQFKKFLQRISSCVASVVGNTDTKQLCSDLQITNWIMGLRNRVLFEKDKVVLMKKHMMGYNLWPGVNVYTLFRIEFIH